MMEKEILENVTSLVDYKKYRWFFTSTGKLVAGGKSSKQNDELLGILKGLKKDYFVTHTTKPGSPFCVILEDKINVKENEKEEAAIFTGCFSKAWKAGERKTPVDIFTLKQVYKTKEMKEGTWGVKGEIKRKIVLLELALTRQRGVLRAVPTETVKNKKEIFVKIIPGKIDKKEMTTKIQVEVSEHFSEQELLSALPSGGIAIARK